MLSYWVILILTFKKSNPARDSTISLFGLDQMITSPTRITPHSYADWSYWHLQHYIRYSCACHTNKWSLSSVLYFLSQNCETWTEFPLLNVHFWTVYRCFKQFDERAFLDGLPLNPVENMYNFSDPNMALPRWTDLFSDVISKYASPQKTALIQT